jgi:GNAT superfamily N-acetyltransferase
VLANETVESHAECTPLTELFSARRAAQSDRDGLVALVNEAYEVEKEFVEGPRTDAESVERALSHGQFLVLHAGDEISACVHLRTQGDDAHFGLLSVSPEMQGRGLGKRLIALAERVASSEGCTRMHINVVNHRRELLGFYTGQGYRASGTAAFPDTERTTREVHFICMEKRL